jgi:hypothetical protein
MHYEWTAPDLSRTLGERRPVGERSRWTRLHSEGRRVTRARRGPAAILLLVVDLLLRQAYRWVLVIGAIVIGAVLFVATSVALVAIDWVLGNPTGTVAAALGVGWLAGYLAVLAVGITWFVRTIGRRAERSVEKAAAVAQDILMPPHAGWTPSWESGQAAPQEPGMPQPTTLTAPDALVLEPADRTVIPETPAHPRPLTTEAASDPVPIAADQRDGTQRPQSRGWWRGWWRGCLIVFGSAFLAASLASDWGGGVPDALVWLARAVVVAGGLLAGVVSARNPSRRNLLVALTMPLPTLGIGWFLIVGLSQSESDVPGVNRIVAIAFLLFEIPILVVFAVRAVMAARAREIA